MPNIHEYPYSSPGTLEWTQNWKDTWYPGPQQGREARRVLAATLPEELDMRMQILTGGTFIPTFTQSYH